MNSSHKLLFIDFYQTLSANRFWEHLDKKTSETICERLFLKNNHLVNPWMRGTISTLEVLEKISCEIFSVSFLFHELERSCTCMRFFTPEIPELLGKIKQETNLQLVLATDNMPVFRDFVIPSLKLDDYFDDYLISCELGVLKDDRSNHELPFFSPFLKEKNIPLHECILFDDSQNTIQRVMRQGMDGFQVKNTRAFLEKLRLYVDLS